VYEQEFKKGESSGIALVLSMPELLIEQARSEIERKPSEDQNEQ
jgi:hypothetical protein